MKRIPLLFVLLLALFTGCEKEEVEEIFSFDISNTKTFDAPKDDVNAGYTAQQAGFNFPLPVTGVSSGSEAKFQENGTTTSLVKNVVPKELILTMPDNSPENFSFIEKMDVEIAMNDGSEQVLLAHNRNIPDNAGKRLVFTPTDNSMDKYIKAGEYKLILTNYKMRRQVTSNLRITANMVFSVTASPL